MNRSYWLPLLAVGLWSPAALAATPAADVVSRAIAHSPEVHAAEAALAASEAQVHDALSGFLPQVSFSGNALQLDGSPVAVFGMPGGQGGQGGFGGGAGMSFIKPGDPMVLGSATVTQPLFAGFRHHAAFHAARSGVEAARLDLERARRAAGLQALQALLQLEARQAESLSAEAQHRQAAARLTLATARAGVGSASELDRLQARVQLSRLTTQKAAARRAEDLARHDLALRLGGEMPAERAIPSVALSFETPEKAFAAARSERLDLRALALREAAADEQITAARAGYWPMVNAFGTVSQLGSDTGNRGTLLGAQLSWVPFDGLKTPAASALAKAQRARHAADREALMQAVQRQVQEAWIRHADAESRLALRQEELAVAQEAQRVARQLRLAGSLTLSEATEAETTLAQAQAELRSAELARAIAALRLAEAAGLSYESLVGKEK